MMKRGKDEEKVMGPMFPRLHVNDTEKGGPRAPPRNTMALYEQLSIPSQRFNPGVLPLHSSNSSNFGSHGSSNQGYSLERNMLPHQASSPTTPLEKGHAHQLEGASKNILGAQLEQRKKPREEDDFSVPVFNTRTGQRGYEIQSSNTEGKHAPLSRTYSGRLVKVQDVTNKDLSRSGSSVIDLRKEVREQGDDRPKICSSREDQMKTGSNLSIKRKFDEHVKESRPSLAEDYGEQPSSRFSRMNSRDDCSRSITQTKDNRCNDRVESVRDSDARDLSQARNGSQLMEDRSSPDEPNSESECHVVEIRGSLQILNGDKSDDASETSMVDSLSGSDLSPDDVVGVIGQKQFWKARRAIVNQQRMFAVQVFELHRLIKVQRLIAGSPHLLLEDSAYFGKPSFKDSTVKKLTSEFAIKPVVQIKCKDDSGKPSHKLECSAENAVGRTSVSSVKNDNQPANYGSYLGNLPPAPAPMDSKTNPWFYHQSLGNQWLVPVMSPSEGLVYKPYPGPGFAGPAYGGCGPMPGNFITPGYGVASPSPHHQGMGFYFPPYGMPGMNPGMPGSAVEHMNQFAQSGLQGHASGGGANFKTLAQQQSSCNCPAEKNGNNSRTVKSKVTKVEGSSANSPDKRVEADRGISNATKERNERNVLPLFPMAPSAEEEAPGPIDTELPTRVIRVVPHNPGSATESAVRIFLSIQEERKQQDAV